jgi:hypothetical protein
VTIFTPARAQEHRMTAVRTLAFAVLCCFALAACDREPTFDASSLPAYQKSLSAIKARLSGQDQHKLELALLTLAAGSAADYTAFALANPSKAADFEALDGVANPLIFLDRMRPRIEGRSAAAVIRKVAEDIDYEISRTESQSRGAEKELTAFVIDNPRYVWDRTKRSNELSAHFSVYNGSRTPISRIYLSGVLTAPEFKTPLAVGAFSYRFSSPLQPGAQQQVTVALVAPGAWTVKQLESTYDADLKLKVSNIDDAGGQRLLAINVDILDTLRRKRDVLRGG